MNRCVVLIGVVTIPLILVGCQSDQGYQIRTFVGLSSIGLDSAGDYIDEFHTRNKGYRVLRISDENGTVRGYLVVSNLLNDQVRIAGERITVTIEDPYYGYLRSAP
jgi:hypothetical protein